MDREKSEYRQLLHRVIQVERSNRRLRLFVGVLLIVSIVLPTIGATGHRIDRSPEESFVLSDDSGNSRAILGFEEGLPGLRLYDQAGRKRLSLELWRNGAPHVELLHENGTVQGELSLANGNLPGLDLRDPAGLELVNLGINAYGSPSLELSNGSYDHHLALTFFKDGFPKLALYGPDFDDRGVFGLQNSGYARLQLFGPQEKERALFEVSPAGVSSFILRGNSGEKVFEAPPNVAK